MWKVPLIVAGVFLGLIFLCLYVNNNKPQTYRLAVCDDVKAYSDKNIALAKSLDKGHHKEASFIREENSKLLSECN